MVSQHNTVQGEDIYYCDFGDWSPRDIDRYLDWYFRYLLDVAKLDKFDVLGHLTYPVRYITGEHQDPGQPLPVRRHHRRDFEDDRAQRPRHRDQHLRPLAEARGHDAAAQVRQALPRAGRRIHHPRLRRARGGPDRRRDRRGHADADRRGLYGLTFYKERQPLPFKII